MTPDALPAPERRGREPNPSRPSALRPAFVLGLTWLYLLLAAVVVFPWTLLTRRLGFLYAAGRCGIRLLFALAGIRFLVEGRANLPPGAGRAGGPAPLYMANHQSNLDPPALVLHLPGAVAFLTKAELFRVPLLGALLRVAGYIPVNRGDRAAAQASLARAAGVLAAGRPFLAFPEGTRGPGTEMLPFKKGPFFLAQQAGVGVIPVTVSGSGALLPRGSWRMARGTIRIRIHAPIPPGEWSTPADPDPAAARDRLARIVAARIASGM